ncbi:SpoIID/LytB domain-containing protein [Thermosynechococcaceae cyanobacterium BACA0444]|uniref:SpoIID/LytB domain-containing protein n=1 Tax=Pseudocalidococcus azoricus BACA0444 TaxID=2918990 RepID=A0AAE4FWD5_9CYAN|nr:SpoIID/LytB domain-containing protein [Pseudocalidococcus azoricus]MDS3862502.1 SpoIID/LytB domain-containing protein [Pseudocalidococcus azoricus BACA0444]
MHLPFLPSKPLLKILPRPAWWQIRPGLVGAGLGLPILGAMILLPLWRTQPPLTPPPQISQNYLNLDTLGAAAAPRPFNYSPQQIPTPFLGKSPTTASPSPFFHSQDLLSARPAPTTASNLTAPPSTPVATQPVPRKTATLAPIEPPKALNPVPPSRSQSPEVRVAVVDKQGQVRIGVSANVQITDDRGQILGTLPANQAVTLQAGGQGLTGWEKPLPTSIWLNPGGQGLVYVDGHWYRGKMRIINLNGTITAINQLELEQYVVAVVGAEVYPSWPLHTLKAQAIAARSYALAQMFRPASRYFDLGNTQRWQVYRGIKDEWNTTQAAVQNTRGIVLTHSGRVMVSMYAATDDIVRDVFGGRGMSQTGAYELGKKGYSYLQILGNYYPGASLSQIQ